MSPKMHYFGMAPKMHYFGLTHQAITPAFSLILIAVIAALAVTMLTLRRHVHG